MSILEFDTRSSPDMSSAVNIYCMTTLVADEASRGGYKELAKSLETVLYGFLTGLTHDEQRQALRMSYELALHGDEPAPPRLRLAYSRD